MNAACKKCNSINVTQNTDVESNIYKGAEYSVDIEYSYCNSCNREFLTKSQIISNEAKVRESKKNIDGLLPAQKIKEFRKYLRLSQTDASVVFGGGQNAFSKYERSEVTQSQAMDKLLRLAASSRYVYTKLLALSEFENKEDVIASVNMPIAVTNHNKQWSKNQFSISATTHEVKLKLVA